MRMKRTQCAHDENELPPRLVFDRGEGMTEHAKAKDHTECDTRSEARSVAIRTLDALDRCLASHFEVEHATFQLEPADHAEHERATHD